MVLLKIAIKNGTNVNYKDKAMDAVKEYLKTRYAKKDVNKNEIYIISETVDKASKNIRVMLGSYQTPKYAYCYVYTGDDKPTYLEVYLRDDVFCVEEIQK